MKIGLAYFSTDVSMNLVELAREAESRGFHSIYVPEHTHIPTSRSTPAPTGDAELAEEYKRSLDPYVALAAAASVTSTLKLGTGVSLVAQHDPIVLAKTLATLDFLSNGRLVLGIGYGWNREEMAQHGVDVRKRRALVREKMLAIQVLWASEKAEFRGETIATVGASGDVTIPQLHFELRLGAKAVDPARHLVGREAASTAGAPTS